MESQKILYYDGTSARPQEVRVLVFNGSINLYDATNDIFIKSFPVKGSSTSHTGANAFVYFTNAGSPYLQSERGHADFDTIQKEVEYANNNWLKKLMKQRIAVLFAIMMSLVIGIYILLITLIPTLGTALISRDVEIELGNDLKRVMLHEEEMIGSKVDSAGTLKLQAFADKIKLSSEYPIRVTLVKSNIANAYALPGGQIVVYSGMMEKIAEPESLVALLAHESAHVNSRHTLRSLLRSAANGILLSIVFSDATGVTAGLVSNVETLRGLDYSRSIEAEADEQGMQLMVKNNVDLVGMKKLMQLLDKEGGVPESVSFLSSHPLTKERIEAAESFIIRHPQNRTISDELVSAFDDLKKME